MLMQRRVVDLALFIVRRDAASVLLTAACVLAVACGDEHKHPRLSQDDASIVGSESDGGGARADGGGLLADGGGLLADGAVPPGPDIDGGTPLGGLDGSLPDGSSTTTPSADASTTSGDAAPAEDAGSVVADGGSSLDASSAPIDAGPCPINHPTYGCGRGVGNGWVVFDNGLEIDRVNRKAWTPVVEVLDDDALRDLCSPLSLGGLTGYDMPQMSDVRTLAAGCAATVPGGSCQVDQNMVLLDEAGDCACSGGVGPNNGKFCRPEVSDCETIWVWTHTDETGWYQHWFYDVDTGSIVPEQVGVGIAVPAKGRCVRDLDADELP
jgi:hypothetical protein